MGDSIQINSEFSEEISLKFSSYKILELLVSQYDIIPIDFVTHQAKHIQIDKIGDSNQILSKTVTSRKKNYTSSFQRFSQKKTFLNFFKYFNFLI